MNAKLRDSLIHLIQDRILAEDDEFHQLGYSNSEQIKFSPVDFYLAVMDDLHSPNHVFDRLRWGGQVVYLSSDQQEVARAMQLYDQQPEYVVETPTSVVIEGQSFLGSKREYFYMVARKVHLIRTEDLSERFTYHLELVRSRNANNQYVVYKGVPSAPAMHQRLRHRFPKMGSSDLKRRALSFTNNIFPMILTREVGILKVLKRHMPDEYQCRFPSVIDLKKNDEGFVVGFTMTWMRNTTGNRTLTHMDFATQAADLLRRVHEQARVIHLDLRPDNMVITEDGVCFIDFGSAVRVGEDVNRNKSLSRMFEQLMRSSGVQRTLRKMCRAEKVTADFLRTAGRKIGRGADLFYLAHKMHMPVDNPDFYGLVEDDPRSEAVRQLRGLAAKLFRPDDPKNPVIRTASDLSRALRRLKARLETSQPTV
jgi:hypothetical protein